MTVVRLNTNFLTALTGAIIFVVFWFAKDDNWRQTSAAWPETILYGIAIFSAILLLQGLLVMHKDPIFSEGNMKRILIACLALLVWSLLIFGLGFVVGSVLTFSVMAFYVASVEKKVSPEAAVNMTKSRVFLWIVMILTEVLVLYYIFSKLLLVPLPKGLFF
ncbi:tripartite tricarboxylate transporter TctB family protein [Halomonas alkalisoli]|uniref:tripartite tricarboxylate transporter TctB family protein n=1 Tax=Halomonas alkalisoli TaxID=2907158 RepID=UPI001F3F4E3F|nr:tripartite tricarboxylate transporter TctB family protein [Halomonas alkalisoli]MCE9684027.1 tripartite tricarboxylate transporter TctB family protein [Halomonas alkalisoli]